MEKTIKTRKFWMFGGYALKKSRNYLSKNLDGHKEKKNIMRKKILFFSLIIFLIFISMVFSVDASCYGHPVDGCPGGSFLCGGSCCSCGENNCCAGRCCPDYCCNGVCTTSGPCCPNCIGKNCGDNGCGGSCGTCTSPQTCVSGVCTTPCTPKTCSQLGKTCGTWNDWCGGTVTCKTCPTGQHCSMNGQCVCDPKTCSQLGKTCGTWDNGCGTNINCGDCGLCATCVGGSCQPKNCDDSNACTDDSCSGGVCQHSSVNCDDGNACTTDSCDPATGCKNIQNCAGKTCGPDGCGGSCGTCDAAKCKICKDGNCVDNRNCDDWCCQDGETCCPKKTVCCNEKTHTCDSFKGHEICRPKDCAKNSPETPKTCGIICCPADKQCGKTGFGIDICMDFNCPADRPEECATDGDKKLCCKSGECECSWGVCGCIPKDCPKGQALCSGEGEFKGVSKCYPIGGCGKHPNGYPRCIEVPPSSKIPVGNPVNTNSFSIYMPRNPDSFTRSGIAYSFEPHGLKFNNFISIDIYAYNIGDLLYRYDNDSYFSDCNINLIQNFNKTINNTGGLILDTNFILTIPNNALTNPTLISASKINISCPNYGYVGPNFDSLENVQFIFMVLEWYNNGEINSSELKDYIKAWIES